MIINTYNIIDKTKNHLGSHSTPYQFDHKKSVEKNSFLAGALRNFLIPPDDFHDFCTPDKLTGVFSREESGKSGVTSENSEGCI